ncbi:MAG: hypothetical protein AAF577_03475 [Pseudomonadota bacterium]
MRRRVCLLLVPLLILAATGVQAQLRFLTADQVAFAADLGRQNPAPGQHRVLFIGNSFTYEHDVPALVVGRAEAEGYRLAHAVLAEGGARLSLTLSMTGVADVLRHGDWDAVVLQDHSTTALDPAYAREGRAAVRFAAWMVSPAPVVLFTPWARAEGHPLYSRRELRPGVAPPRTPAAMTAATSAQAEMLLADLPNLRHAPVARAWADAIAAGAALHAPDRYHANMAGAALTAEVLWATLAPLLAASEATADAAD